MVAALIAEPSRAAILWQLADGRAVSAEELARGARISANDYFGQTQGDADSSFSVAASAG
jgi:DNA-binding transcriptional ArsR family regulator